MSLLAPRPLAGALSYSALSSSIHVTLFVLGGILQLAIADVSVRTIVVFAIRFFSRRCHFGIDCRSMSMLLVLATGFLSDIGAPILYFAYFCEALYPTLGDEVSDA